MNWDAMGALGEIVGALAVLITILFLARQINSGASVAKTSVRSDLMTAYGSFNDLIASTPELAAVLTKLGDPENLLTPAETVQIRHLAYRMTNLWNTAQAAYDNQQIAESEFQSYKDDVTAMTRLYPGLESELVAVIQYYPSLWGYEIYKPLVAKIPSNS